MVVSAPQKPGPLHLSIWLAALCKAINSSYI